MNVEKLKPTFNRVLVKKIREEKTSGGIFIPLTVEDDKTLRVVILALGPEANNTESVAAIEQQFEVGQDVIMTKYAGVQLEKEGDYYLITNRDIIAIVE